MTTPEKLRRRQLVEGVMLITIGIFMVLQSLYAAGEDREQRQCLSDNFQTLSKALDVRSSLTDRDSTSKSQVIAAVAAAEDDNDVREAFDTYTAQQEKIDQARKDNPLPPYPIGECTE